MTITIDKDSEIVQYSPICTFCRHAQGFRRCAAFGDTSIPLPIWIGENDHREPYAGDNGIIFSPAQPMKLGNAADAL